MGLERNNRRAGMSIFGCFVVVVISGITLAFSLLAKTLKDLFCLNQVEVSFLASAISIGHNISLPAGCFNDKMGPRLSMVPGCVFTCLGWGTVLITLLERDKLGHDLTLTLLSIAFIAAGHGRTYFFLAGLSTVTYNVPEKLRPTVLAFMENLSGLIPLIYPIVFGGSLQGDNSYVTFVSFLSCSLGLSLAGGLSGAISMTQKAVIGTENNGISPSLGNGVLKEDGPLIEDNLRGNLNYETTNSKLPLPMDDLKKSRSTLLSLDYQLIFWTASILTAIALFYDCNTAFLLIALGHKVETVNVITLFRGTNTGTGFFVCVCFYLCQTIRGFPYLLPVLCGVFTVIFVFLVAFFSQYLWCLELSYALLGAMCGMVYVFPGVLICDIYGANNFGRNYGLVNSAIPILVLILNFIFSYIYDNQIEDQGTMYCYGKHCFTFPFISTLVLSVLCTILSPVIYIRRRKSWKSTEMQFKLCM